MVNFSDRQKKILSLLLKSDEYIKSDYIAGELAISKKTVQREINTINMLLTKLKANKIESLRGRGYAIPHESKKAIQFVFKDYEDKDALIPNMQQSRIEWIIRKFAVLSMEEKGYTLENFADELFVSLTTLKKDMNSVKDVLQRYNIQLSKISNKGLKLKGEEKNIRQLIVDYLVLEQSELHLDKIFSISSTDKVSVEEVVIRNIRKHRIPITDIGFRNLIIHVEIAISRLRLDNGSIDQKPNMIEEESDEYRCAKSISKEIETKINLHIPENEIVNIYLHLLGQKRMLIREDTLSKRIKTPESELLERVLVEINEMYQLDFRQDDILKNGLLLHLESALHRIRLNMPINNELIEEIKNNYPFPMQLAKLLSSSLEKTFNIKIDVNEVGFLTLHFCGALERANSIQTNKEIRAVVVCTTGLGTSVLLKAKLQSKLNSNIKVVGVYAMYQLDDIEFTNVDIIISTVPLPKKYLIPDVVITPIVSDDDIKKIQEFITYGSTEFSISSLFYEELFFSELNYATKNECLSVMAEKIYDLGFIDEKCKESIFARENMATTEIGNGVCVPHNMDGKVFRSSICFGIIKDPILWEFGKVQLIVMIIVDKKAIREYKELFLEIYEKVDYQYKVDEFIKQKNFIYLKKLFN
ncbi:licABCH operon regulator [Carnobacterium sp. 17-4]|uniref:BglG family transcription antiterminator n=1 Tax=Carnobacterium sp. (strain 17-4) TaxID=208596 RepID=UPI0002058EE9|nr:BglG family transcription antiterminator [Carnobacterium sp. 17-4]AEB30815.1 licABCH operon regulator [Carnobacterium sp. 17-4]